MKDKNDCEIVGGEMREEVKATTGNDDEAVRGVAEGSRTYRSTQ